MNFPTHFLRHRLIPVTTVILILAFAASGQTTRPATDNSASKRELNMLVLGDSILWGQGLKQENKSWYLVKTWLEENGAVSVREKVLAHAGAMVGAAGASPPQLLDVHGEVNSGWPTLHDQIDDALRSFVDPSQVDLVLVDGCINDVNARRFLNAGNTPETIETLVREKCGAPVEALLTRIASTFPNAHTVITGYYTVISNKTPRDLFMRALAKKFYVPAEANGRRPSDKQLIERLTMVSATWYEASNRALMGSVARVNANLASRGSRQQVLFARISLLPEHAFAARHSHLWGFNASTLRKLLALITLGRVGLYANDEVRSQRSSVCADFYKPAPNETKADKSVRKEQLLICRLAAIAHPNRKGAALYAEAIKEQLQIFLRSPGWLRTVSVTESPSR